MKAIEFSDITNPPRKPKNKLTPHIKSKPITESVCGVEVREGHETHRIKNRKNKTLWHKIINWD